MKDGTRQAPGRFGQHLRQFAHSMDFINSTHYKRLNLDIAEFLVEQLNAVTVGLFEPCSIDGARGLKTAWCLPPFELHETLEGPDGYRRQLALALGKRRNLWVVADGAEHLSKDKPGVDMWNREDRDIPPFQSSHDQPKTWTQIILLVRNAHHEVNGAFLIELGQKVLPTTALRADLQTIAEAVGLLKATSASTEEQVQGTRVAIRELERIKAQTNLETGPRPSLFFAYSETARRDVVNATRQVLDEFKDHVVVRDWKAMHTPGNINLQVTETILNARYGVCLLSEEVPVSGPDDVTSRSEFQDNPNVLMEAGMLHMVTEGNDGVGTGWVPIRESSSLETPFDLISQRMVPVHRGKDKRLKKKKFEADLRAKLSALINIPSDKP